jgi:hypothetical protein
MKRKSFPFYYEKYIARTYYLIRREKGAYIDLLCYQADKGSMTIENIKEVLNGDFDCWEKIKGKFIEQNGIFINKKLESVNGKHKKTPDEIEVDRVKLQNQINEKKLKLYDDLKPFLAKYPKEMLRQFYNYWTELNKSGSRMRFELQQTFEIGKRLATWARNDKEFVKVETPKTYDEMVKLHEKDPNVFNKYKPVKKPGERQATFYPINQTI